MRLNIILLCMLSLFSIAGYAQVAKTFALTGTVVDKAGNPIANASLSIKNKIGIGVSTTSDGRFKMNVTLGDVVVSTFVGLETVEYPILKEDTDIVIHMTKESAEIDEVIVVGMGTQRKISNLAAISTVNVEELQGPAPSIANMLGGRMPGVIAMQGSGEPGKNISEFWIRGIGTFGANSGALVLIDGLEGDLNSIDPADVQSFSILKDASATAVYGVRGANGVVLVTTKRGEAGKMNVVLRNNFSSSHLKRMPKYLRAYEYAKLLNEALEVRNTNPAYSAIDLDIIQNKLDPDMFPDVNWQDEILKKSSFENTHYASARGGADVARYFLSLGFSNETAAYNQNKNSVYSSNVGYNTYNYRLNIDLNLTPSTSLFLGTDGFMSVRKEPGIANTDYIWNAQSQLNPLLFPTVYSNGLLPARGANDLSSPYVMINHTGQSMNQDYKGKATLALNQDFSQWLPGLKFKAQGAFDMNNYFWERRYIQPALFNALGRSTDGTLIMKQTVDPSPAAYGKSTQQYRKYHFESTLNYEKSFASVHRITALAYYYVSDEKATADSYSSLSAIPLRYQGVSSRLTYSYNDTYMMDVNFGYTGSENFQPGKQYGFFPSVAVGWSPTNYNYFKEHVEWLNYFKVRASYGSVGNDRISSRRFPYLTMVDIGKSTGWTGNSLETINESIVGADNLQWEKALKANVGFEGKLWNNKIDFVVDFFHDQRNGIFQPRIQIPDYVGAISMPYGNIGRMRSYGSDGNISFHQKVNDNVSFTVRGNFTYAANEVQNWEQVNLPYDYLQYSGFPYNVIRGYQTLGLFKDEFDVANSPKQNFGVVMPGDIKYKDVNGDAVINEDDKVPLSNSTYPRTMYGIGGEVTYKKFTLGFLLRGTGKTDYYHVGQGGNGMGYVPFHGGATGNVLDIVGDVSNRWIPMSYALENNIDPSLAENPNARFPRLQYGYNANNSQLSDFWKGNASYLRLQEVTLGYTLTADFLKRARIRSVDLQLVGNNIYVWDKVKIFDPEQANKNGRVYPIPSVYTLQFYVNF